MFGEPVPRHPPALAVVLLIDVVVSAGEHVILRDGRAGNRIFRREARVLTASVFFVLLVDDQGRHPDLRRGDSRKVTPHRPEVSDPLERFWLLLGSRERAYL